MTTQMLSGSDHMLNELQEEVVYWANQAHPGRTAESTMLKLFEEIGEMISDPRDASEYADVIIMLLDIAWQNDIKGSDLELAVRNKMEINRARKWRVTKLGTLKHE